MLVTIHEVGPDDGKVITIPDGSHFIDKIVPPMLDFNDPEAMDVSVKRIRYTVEEYAIRRPGQTAFALVHPDLKRKMLGQ